MKPLPVIDETPSPSDAYASSTDFWTTALASPCKVAVVDTDGSPVTFGELSDRTNQLAHVLLDRGLVAGDHLAFMMRNRIEVLEVALAATQIGLWYTPISYQARPDEIAYILHDSQAKAVVVDGSTAEVGRAAADTVGLHARGRLAAERIEGFDDLRGCQRGMSAAAPAGRSAGGPFCYTSGTTGKPKGVVRRTAPTDIAIVGRDARVFGSIYGWSEQTVTLVQGPMYHIGPLANAVNVLHLGGSVVIMPRWTAESCLDSIARYRVTATMMVPTMLRRLLALPTAVRAHADVSSLGENSIPLGGAICPADVKTRMIEWWGPVFFESYGGTEGVFSRITSQDALLHPGSVGRPWPGVTLRIVDESGSDCQPGEVGVVYGKVAGPDGWGARYFNAPEKTAASYLGDYFTLGDLGYVDQDGWLYLSDRRDDLIIVGGANVYPAEVEHALAFDTRIEDVVVVGLPDEDMGHEVVAVVQLAEGIPSGDGTAQDILESVRTRLSRYKCPRRVVFVDRVERNDVGKVNRSRIRAALSEADRRKKEDL